jgi:pimeloyl-ACP methyl ester carboxylesterase
VHPRERTASVSARLPDGPVRGVAVVLHGGREHSMHTAEPWRLTALRMRPFVRTLIAAGRGDGLAVWTVGYRYRGWNGEAAHPVADARWVLDQIAGRYGDVPAALVGHSMGARAALRVADHPRVVSIAALAPWLPEGEPVEQLADRTVLIAHGDRERMTDPRLSYDYALRAREVTSQVCRFDVRGDGHAMLGRARDWHDLVRRFVIGTLRMTPLDAEIANALRDPSPGGLRVPLSRAR